jgi:hypothetical protein
VDPGKNLLWLRMVYVEARKFRRSDRTRLHHGPYLHGYPFLMICSWLPPTLSTSIALFGLNGLGHGPYPGKWHVWLGRSPRGGVEQWNKTVIFSATRESECTVRARDNRVNSPRTGGCSCFASAMKYFTRVALLVSTAR